MATDQFKELTTITWEYYSSYGSLDMGTYICLSSKSCYLVLYRRYLNYLDSIIKTWLPDPQNQ